MCGGWGGVLGEREGEGGEGIHLVCGGGGGEGELRLENFNTQI